MFFGLPFFIMILFCIGVLFFCGCLVIFFDFLPGLVCFVLLLVFIAVLILAILDGCCNFIYISDEKVWSKKESYDWDSVSLTVSTVRQHLGGIEPAVCIFFDDHYLTTQEVLSKEIKRKGFYLELTVSRAKHILPFYNKPLRIINESPVRWNLFKLLHEHNKKYDDPREFL